MINLKKSNIFLIVSLMIFFSLFVVVQNTLAENELEERLAGRILLQVENNGEAWYVNPQSKERSFLGRPDDAFKVMREQGIGISNTNLEKISIGLDHSVDVDSDNDGLSDRMEEALGTNPNNSDTDGDGYNDYEEISNNYSPLNKNRLDLDKSFAEKQKGKIFLAVERNGEAWYVDPDDNKRYFLGRPDDAFQLMRKKGLGVTNKNLNQVRERTQNQERQQDNNEDDKGNTNNTNTSISTNQDLVEQYQNLDFTRKIIDCNDGEKFNYKLNRLNPFNYQVYNSDNAVTILENNEDGSCKLEIKTTGYFENVSNLSDEELVEYILASEIISEEDLDFVTNSTLGDLENDERFEDLFSSDNGEAIINTDSDNYDSSQSFVEWFRNILIDLEDNEYDESVNMVDEFINICSGQPEDLLKYFSNLINENNINASCSIGSETICTYNDSVVCTQETINY